MMEVGEILPNMTSFVALTVFRTLDLGEEILLNTQTS